MMQLKSVAQQRGMSRRTFLRAAGLTVVGLSWGWRSTIPATAQPQFQIKWKTSFSSELGVPALGSDGTLYVPVADGSLQALKPSDGSVKWSFQPGGPLRRGVPVVGLNDTVYITIGNTLYALDPTNGSVQARLDDHSLLAIGSDGTIYTVQSQYSCPSCPAFSSGGIIARTPSGSGKWTAYVPLDSGWHASPLDGPVVDDRGNVYAAFNLETGRGEPRAPVALAVNSSGQQIYATLFGRPLQRSYATLALGPDRSLYVSDFSGRAIHRIGGSGGGSPGSNWAPATGVVIGPDGTLYATVQERFGRKRGGVAAFSSSGNLSWFNESIAGDLIVGAGNTLYLIQTGNFIIPPFGSLPPVVMALNASDGSRRGQALDLAGAGARTLGNSVLSSDGMLYVTGGSKSGGGILFAIDTGGQGPARGWPMFRASARRDARLQV